jgi:hypothetical protein
MAYPGVPALGCSTAGEIFGANVLEHSFCALAIRFSDTRVKAVLAHVSQPDQSGIIGAELGSQLAAPDLRHVFVLSDGLHINGSTLTSGLRSSLPASAKVTGGLAGDNAAFKQTFVGLNDDLGPRRVAAVGFYGDKLKVSCGSAGGWQPFGPKRLITQSKGNILYRLDDQPALALYKRYLGERASGLPATGLLFPLQLLQSPNGDCGLVRTILGIDEEKQSLTFAGDMPEGRYTQLMKASSDALVSGAENAASQASDSLHTQDRLALLVSCVGRKIVLGQRVEEEVEAVLAQLGAKTLAAGFYSYGEISPSGLLQDCELHNQTMTLTVFSE